MTTIRLTMAQALIGYLAAQTSEVEGREVPLFAVFLRFPSTLDPSSRGPLLGSYRRTVPVTTISDARLPWPAQP